MSGVERATTSIAALEKEPKGLACDHGRRLMSSTSSRPDVATLRLLSVIDDAEIARRYPNGTHFIGADQPGHGSMATRALFEGDAVALVFPDGHELLLTPAPVRGLTPLRLLTALLLGRRGRKPDAGAVHAPLGARIEARDSTGRPIAA